MTAVEETKSDVVQSISDPIIKDDERHCTTISAAAKALLASGGFALMTNDTKGAARSIDETYPWHCICVLRIGSVLWVYDPAFDPASMPLKQRIGQISGLMMAKALWTWFGKHGITISDMRITGAADDQDRCISLSCLWMEQMVIAGRAQWPSLENCAAWRELNK